MRIEELHDWFCDSGLAQGEGGVLGVGWGEWPDEFPEAPSWGWRHRAGKKQDGELDAKMPLRLPKGICMARFQVGGMYCHQRFFFGMLFELPQDDPLCTLGRRDRKRGCVTRLKLDDVLDLRRRLRTIGLDVDPSHYHEFMEAYVPLDPRKAWRYALRRGLGLIEGPFNKATPVNFTTPRELRVCA